MFGDLMREAYSYSYYEQPNYEHLISLLKQILSDNQNRDNMKFSWNWRFFHEFRSIINGVEPLAPETNYENFDEDDLNDKINSKFLDNPSQYDAGVMSNMAIF